MNAHEKKLGLELQSALKANEIAREEWVLCECMGANKAETDGAISKVKATAAEIDRLRRKLWALDRLN